jgi:hypothetical protein
MIGRRDFLGGISGVAAAALFGLSIEDARADDPPETTRLCLIKTQTMCWAPQYVAEDFLKAEGFTQVTYTATAVGLPVSKLLAGRDADISMNFVGPNLIRVDQGDPMVFLVDKQYTSRYDYALQVMKELPYGKWREYDPEDTIRFYALRLHEAGLIKSNPQKLIAHASDWRVLNELKKELKG